MLSCNKNRFDNLPVYCTSCAVQYVIRITIGYHSNSWASCLHNVNYLCQYWQYEWNVLY